MFHITRDDLAKKSDAQLKSLFNQAVQAKPSARRAFAQVSFALRLIRDEIARRGLRL
ncbi:hypothetical protein OVA03_12775 [Asticcacaulis sp. SL142]|uniref:hypothetical protein n=1 Tax=Asticcacaulis sp. SL142 TaxID=2995155 RepID=UPI00226C9740|nr:hypothetical protein [Asticcacaulis sp. SL142]WAC47570.1 hypothetical protein OVA03_12775 [Asticcacaulis sp. SL142]